MKRFSYIIMTAYYGFAWIGMFYTFLPTEANVAMGVVGLLAIGESPENVELSNMIYTIGWSIFFATLILFTTLSHFWKKIFNGIPIVILSILLFFNMFLLIHGMFMPLLINIALIPMTVYIGKTEKTPEEIQKEKDFEVLRTKYFYEFINND